MILMMKNTGEMHSPRLDHVLVMHHIKARIRTFDLRRMRPNHLG